MLYGVVLKEKEGTLGLTRSEVLDLHDMLGSTEGCPI